MSQANNMCNLCLNTCGVGFYKGLYEDFEVYKVTTKYFDLASFNMDDDPRCIICLECCGLMTDFYYFQKRVVKAHDNLMTADQQVDDPQTTTDELETTQKKPLEKKKSKLYELLGSNDDIPGGPSTSGYQVPSGSNKNNDGKSSEVVEYGDISLSKPYTVTGPWSEFVVDDKSEGDDQRRQVRQVHITPMPGGQFENPELNQSDSVGEECQMFEYDNTPGEECEFMPLEVVEAEISTENPEESADFGDVKEECETISLSDEEIRPTTSTSMNISEDEEPTGKLRPAFQCTICSKTFVLRKMIQRHFREEHPTEKVIFRSKKVQFYNEERVACIECDLIAKSFCQNATKDSKYNYWCLLCLKVCPTRAGLRNHMSVHMGPELFKCRRCSGPANE